MEIPLAEMKPLLKGEKREGLERVEGEHGTCHTCMYHLVNYFAYYSLLL